MSDPEFPQASATLIGGMPAAQPSSPTIVTHRPDHEVVPNKVFRFTTFERGQAVIHEFFYKWRDPEREEYANGRYDVAREVDVPVVGPGGEAGGGGAGQPRGSQGRASVRVKPRAVLHGRIPRLSPKQYIPSGDFPKVMVDQFARALAQEKLIKQRETDAAHRAARLARARAIFVKNCGNK